MTLPSLAGIIPPLVTPLCDRDTLDVPGLERLVEHVLAGGVHGLFLLGTTGEGPSLSYRLRRELIDRVCRQVALRVPVLAAITDTAIVESLSLARHAADAGVQAVVVAPPYYMPPNQADLAAYVEHLVAELPLPLMLYNMPEMTKVSFAPETIRRLLDQPGIIGLKDSSGDSAYFDRALAVARGRPDWSVLIGPEELLAYAVARGGHGGVSGGANLAPRLFVDLVEAARRGDEARTAALQQKVVQLGRIYHVGYGPSAVIKGLKCALSLAGLCDDVCAEPLSRFDGPDREKVRAILGDLGIF